MINELDTIHFYINKYKCYYDEGIQPTANVLGASYKIIKDNIFFNISSKLFVTPTALGAITKNNFEEITKIIANAFNIVIEPNYLYEYIPLSRVDVKKDCIMSASPRHYISELRNYFNKNTGQYSIYRFDDYTYPTGLKLIPKAKKKHAICIYDKGYELTKARNKKLKSIFENKYLDELKHCLRVELQLKNYANIRKFFDLGSEANTFKNLFEKDLDVLGEALLNIF